MVCILMKFRLGVAALLLLLAVGAFGFLWARPRSEVISDAAPTVLLSAEDQDDAADLQDVLDLAEQARSSMIQNMDDYTANFVKQERDESGVLSPETIMFMKVQTRHRGGELGTPMRVYLKWTQPESMAGREVIWAEDLHDGKLLVHETGLLGMIPIPPLDPYGVIAMQGQRYPISDIGQTRLVEQLIERGKKDLHNPSVSVAIQRGVDHGDTQATLIQVKHGEPTDDPDDFALAEVLIDEERQLILRYRSFGWPEPGGESDQSLPLLESYSYENIQLNVGLSEKDFDPSSPEYSFQ